MQHTNLPMGPVRVEYSPITAQKERAGFHTPFLLLRARQYLRVNFRLPLSEHIRLTPESLVIFVFIRQLRLWAQCARSTVRQIIDGTRPSEHLVVYGIGTVTRGPTGFASGLACTHCPTRWRLLPLARDGRLFWLLAAHFGRLSNQVVETFGVSPGPAPRDHTADRG